MARPAAGGPRVRAVRARRRRAARGAAPRGASRSGSRPSSRSAAIAAGRGARGARRRASAARAAARAADARAVSLRPPGRRARDLPARAGALVEQIGVEPGPELRALHEAILRPGSGARRGPRRPSCRRSSRQPRRWSAATPSWSACATPGSGRAAGRGGVVVVSGPAGIGRTRLAAELAGEVHRQGALVLYGAGRHRAGARRAAADAARARRRRGAAAIALAEAVRELASRPVLVVAIAGDADAAGGCRAPSTSRSGRSARTRSAAIAALYAPGRRGDPRRGAGRAQRRACRGARIGSPPSGRAREAARRLTPGRRPHGDGARRPARAEQRARGRRRRAAGGARARRAAGGRPGRRRVPVQGAGGLRRR